MQLRGIRMGRALLCATLAAGSIGTWAPPAPAQNAAAALNQAPEGVEAVLVVPSLAALSEQIAQLKADLGLPMPELDDALGEFKQSLGMVNGVNDDGSLILVMPDFAQALEGEQEPEFLLLMPVSDYGAFVQSFTGGEAAAGEGTTAITLPDGQPGFVRSIDGHAVMGPNRELVDGYTAGNAAAAIIDSVGDVGETYINDADAMLYLNLEQLAPTLLPMLDQALQQQATDLGDQAAAGLVDPAMAGNAQRVMEAYGETVRTILEGSRGFVVALDLTKNGVALTDALGLKPGSELAEFFGDGADAEPQGLSQLPDQPFIVAGAVDMDAMDVAGLYRMFIEAMPKDPNNPLLQNVDQWMPLIEQVHGLSTAFYAPNENAMMSGSVLNTITVLDVENPQDYVQRLQQYIETMNGMTIPAGPNPMAAEGDAQELQIRYTTSYTPNVLQLQGVQVDQYQVTTVLPPEMMQQMGPAAGFMGMFTNYSGYVATKDGKVLVTTVADPQLITAGFQTIEQGGGVGAAGAINRIREAALPPNASAEVYVSIGGIAQAANLFLGMMGVPPINVPADLAPIASGLGAQGDSAAFRVYLPTDTLRFIVDTAQTMQNQMGGPGEPGGPGRGPGGPPPF